jgi:hypothetical protein
MKHKWPTWPFDRQRCLVCGIPWVKENEATDCTGEWKDYFKEK